MQGGKLRHRVAIQAVSHTRTDSGQATPTWATGAVVRAAINPQGGSEGRVASQIRAEGNVPVVIRFRRGVSPKQRLLCEPVKVTAVAATDVLTITEATELPVVNDMVFRLFNDGGSLPAGLSADTDYYVVSASGSTFKLAATRGGAAINITDAGTGTHYVFARLLEIVSVKDLDMRHRELMLACTETK